MNSVVGREFREVDGPLQMQMFCWLANLLLVSILFWSLEVSSRDSLVSGDMSSTLEEGSSVSVDFFSLVGRFGTI